MGEAKRLMLIGAHPDDCEWMGAGLAAACARTGWTVRFVSVTNGNAGHMGMGPKALAARRLREARTAAARIGATYATLGEPDGRLYVTERSTANVVTAIRRFAPDVLVTHRTCDYHRDHRYTAQLVLDASFVVVVPLVVPAAPALARKPVILYACDHFTEGPPFRPDVVLDTAPSLALRTRMLLDHVSQFREWIPWLEFDRRVSRARPFADTAKLAAMFESTPRGVAKRFAAALRKKYGRRVTAAEAYQLSEYGRTPPARELAALLPR